MNRNIVTAVFGANREARTATRYRYDYGQVLMLDGIVDLPEYYETHFAKSPTSAEALRVMGTSEGVSIPDSLLQTAGDIYAWVYLHTGESDGETVYRAIIPVVDRPEPEDPSESPIDPDIVEQAIIALNQDIESVEVYAEQAEASAQNAALSEGNAATSAAAAAGSATAAATSASSAKGYMDTAGEYSDDALGYSTQAGSRASAAAQSATAANHSANNAAASATAAAGSATNAANSATAAAASAAEAKAVEESIPEDYSELSADVVDLKSAKTEFDTMYMLTTDAIPGTTQTPVFVDGAVTQITHTDEDDNVIRTDAFTIGTSSIVETRTLDTGDVLTLTTDLTTLETTAAYTPAA